MDHEQELKIIRTHTYTPGVHVCSALKVWVGKYLARLLPGDGGRFSVSKSGKDFVLQKHIM